MSITIASMDARERALELVDIGLIDSKTLLNACLQYMFLDEVEDMMHCNEFEPEIDYE